MSSSEKTLEALSCELDDAVTAAIDSGSLGDADPATVTRIVTAAVRLYGALAELNNELAEPLDDRVSPTEAVVMATAMLRARDLNPFDLALWFTRA